MPAGITPGLFKHTTNPLNFCLIVDDFGIKYTSKQDTTHLVTHLNEAYTTTVDWTGRAYAGFRLDWNYLDTIVELCMRGYVKGACKICHYPTQLVPEHYPHP